MANDFENNLEKFLKATTRFALDQAGKQWMKVVSNEKRERNFNALLDAYYLGIVFVGVPAYFIYDFYQIIK